MRVQHGYTLIELMIVVAIIAILSAIAISQYQDYLIRSQVSEGMSLAAGVTTAVSEYYNNKGHFPRTACADGNQAIGLAMPTSIVGSYVSELRVAGDGCVSPLGSGSVVVLFSSRAPQKANVAIDTAALIFAPIVTEGSVSWQCKRFLIAGSVVLRDKWIPTSCR